MVPADELEILRNKTRTKSKVRREELFHLPLPDTSVSLWERGRSLRQDTPAGLPSPRLAHSLSLITGTTCLGVAIYSELAFFNFNQKPGR